MSLPSDPVEYGPGAMSSASFDPHVALALLCLVVALLIVLFVSLIPLDTRGDRDGSQRK